MRKPLVLIVDDSMDQRSIAATMLQHNGYDTIEADSAWTAERLLASNKPDVLLLDLRMPLKSGIQLLRDIAPSRAQLNMRVVVYSSFADLHKEDLQQLGVTAIIDKSATPEQFMQIIDRAAGRTAAENPIRR